MPKYLSGRVKRTGQAYLSTDRYQYLGLEQAEPNLGDPPSASGSPNIPVGQRLQIVSIPGRPGERFWVPVEGGLIPGAISVFDEGTIVGGPSSTTQLNIKGNIITAEGNRTGLDNPGIAVTLTVAPPGSDGQIIFNNNGDFGGSTLFNYDNSTVGVASVGIGTSSPTHNLHVKGDFRLENSFIDSLNNSGNQGQLLIVSAAGGLEYANAATVPTGAGGTFNNVQFHDNTGLVDGASNFVYVETDERVGIGSTQPRVLLDVVGIASFSDLRLAGIFTASIEQGGFDFETDVRFKGANYNAEWDISENALEFEDNAKAKFGTDLSKELEIFFDGTHSKIDHTSTTGSLFLAGDSLVLSNSGMSQYYLQAAENGSVLLNYSGNTKFQTAETGAIVTGIFTATQEIQADKITTIDNNFVHIDVSGIATMGELDSNFIDSEQLDVGFATVTDLLDVTGFTTAKNVFVAGVSTFSHLEVDNVKITDNKIESLAGNLILESATTTITANDVLFVDNDDDSNSKDSGSVITQGGVGIEKSLNVGINFNVAGVTTLASNGGITTTGGDFYIGGDLYVNDDISLDNVNANSVFISGISTFIGLSTFNNGISVESGITTFRDNVLVSTGATVGFGDSIFIPDDKKIILGDNNDFQISHTTSLASQLAGDGNAVTSGSDRASLIEDAGQGPLVFKSNHGGGPGAFQFFDADWRPLIRMKSGGADLKNQVILYFNSEERIKTTGVGVSVIGITSMTGNLKVGQDVESNLTPSAETFDLGASGKSWQKLYIKEIIGTDKISVDESTIENLKVTGFSTFQQLAYFEDKVGIGTTNPFDPFDGGFEKRFQVVSGGEEPYLFSGGNFVDAEDVLSVTTKSGYGGFNINVRNQNEDNPLWTIRTFQNEPIAFGQGTSEIARFSSDGNLGIGTTNPGLYKLHVKSPIATIARFERTTDQGGGSWAKVDIKAGTSSGNSYLTFSDVDATEIGSINYEHNNDSLIFNVNSQDRLFIKSSGHVGINEDNPIHQLSVGINTSTAWASSKNISNTTNNDFIGLNLDNKNSGSNPEIGILLQAGESSSGQFTINCKKTNTNTADLIFRTRSGGAASKEVLSINKDGDLLPGGTDQDIGSSTAKWGIIYATELKVDDVILEQQVETKNLLVTGISTFIGLSTFNNGISVESGLSTFRGKTFFDENVGIKSETPSVELAVVGVTSVTGDIVAKAPGTEDFTILHGGTIELNRGNNDSFIDFKTTYAEDADCRISAASNGLSFSTGGNTSISEKVLINSSGKVEFKGDSNPVAEFDRGSDNKTNLDINYNGTLTGQLSGADQAFEISASGSNTPIDFYVNGSKRVTINKDGDLLRGGANQDIGTNDNKWGTIYAETIVATVDKQQSRFETVTLDVTGIATIKHLNVTGVSTFQDNVKFTGANYDVTWTKAQDSLKFTDNAKLTFGSTSSTNPDLKIYHSSNNNSSYIEEDSSADFYIQKNGKDAILIKKDDLVSLHHNGGERLKTTSTGVYISGELDTGTAKVRDLANNEVVFISGNVGKLEGSSDFTWDGQKLYVNGNLEINGTLTYDDVTNIDAVGIVTAQTGVRITNGGLVVNAGISTFEDKIVANNVIQPKFGNNNAAGIQWLDNFHGSGSGDKAYIRYYLESGNETTTLEIAAKNDSDDKIKLNTENVTATGNLTVTKDLTVSEDLTVTKNSTLKGNVDLGDSNLDTISMVGDVDTNITPSTNAASTDDANGKDIGASGAQWRKIYAREFVGAVTGVSDDANQIKVTQEDGTGEQYLTFVSTDPTNDGSFQDLKGHTELKYTPSSSLLVVPSIKPSTIITPNNDSGTANYYLKADGNSGWSWSKIEGNTGLDINFTDLKDTPANYTSATSGQVVVVNSNENGLTFANSSGVGAAYVLQGGGSNGAAFGSGTGKLELLKNSTLQDTVTITAGTNVKIDTTSTSGFTISADSGSDTTYELKCTKDSDGGSTGTNSDPYLFLDASGTGTDSSVQIVGSGGISVTRDSNGNKLTLNGSSAGSNTTYDLEGGGQDGQSFGTGTGKVKLVPSSGSTDEVTITAGDNIKIDSTGTSGFRITAQDTQSANTTYDLEGGGSDGASFGSGTGQIILKESGTTNEDPVTITAGANIKIDNTGSNGFTITAQNTQSGGTVTDVDVKQKTGNVQRTCGDILTVSGTTTKTITIPDTSNAYGAKYIQSTEPTTNVCDGDVWFDTTASGGGSGGDDEVTITNTDENNFRNLIFADNSNSTTLKVNDAGRLQVNPNTGTLNVSGDITAFHSSDKRLKDNIIPIPNAVDKVLSISGNTFNWNAASEYAGKGDTGVIAQEVEVLNLPGVTTTRDDGTKAVRYDKLIPLLIEAIKELKDEIDELKRTK